MDAVPSTSDGRGASKRRREEVFRYSDPNFETKIMKCLEELEAEEDSTLEQPIDDSDDDPDYEEQPEILYRSNESSEDEYDSEDNNTEHQDIHPSHSSQERTDNLPDYFLGKNGFKWNSTGPSTRVKTTQHNIVRGIPGMSNTVRALGPKPQIEDIWSLLFDQEILQETISWTNVKLEAIREKVMENQKSNYRATDEMEIKALLGLLMLTAIYKSNREDMLSLFSTKSTGRPIFRAVMSVKRFEILIGTLRFDDPGTRVERKKDDPAAAITNIFQRFVNNCQKLYSLGAYSCIDEMLIPFRGRCKFKVYMPAKPNKYGLKVLALTDARTSYFYNAYLYCGKGTDGRGLSDDERKLSIPTQTVLRLIPPIINSNRNITADNWFSSMELVQELQKRKLTYVGTLKKNKREVPKEFLPDRKREIGSSLYGFTKDITLLSYVPKKNKAVLVISSMHHCASLDMESNKPEVIAFYNSTKGGIDCMDQKCANYSTNRRSRRWPLSVFYMLINISVANSYILYLCFQDVPPLKRFVFTENLALALVRPHLNRRLSIVNMRQDLRTLIQTVLGNSTEATPRDKTDKLAKRRKCSLCPYTKNRNTSYKCIKCEKPICLECSRKMCVTCCEEL